MKLNQNEINPALRDFDQLPDSAHIRPQTAKLLLGISIATFWRLVSKKAFPVHKLTERTTTVRVSDLRAFMNNKVEG